MGLVLGPGDPSPAGQEPPPSDARAAQDERHRFVGGVNFDPMQPACRTDTNRERRMPPLDDPVVRARRVFPVSPSQNDGEKRPRVVMQTIVVAGVEPVDVEAEPPTGHDPEPSQIQLPFMPVDQFPPPELQSGRAHPLGFAVWWRTCVIVGSL